MNRLKFYLLLSSLVISLSCTSTHTMSMNGLGIKTEHGSLEWKTLIELPGQVTMLRRLYFLSAAAILGFIVYKQWQKSTLPESVPTEENK